MGELARKRSARDLWISRGHLWAAAVLFVSGIVGSYSLGFMNGGGAQNTVPAGLNASELEPVEELLDRIEGSTADAGGVRTLTFPSVLKEQTNTPLEESEDSSGVPGDITRIGAGEISAPVVVISGLKRGEIALQIALKLMSDGYLVGRKQSESGGYILSVAGFDNLETARASLGAIQSRADAHAPDATLEIFSR
jgi:hypothetical protein